MSGGSDDLFEKGQIMKKIFIILTLIMNWNILAQAHDGDLYELTKKEKRVFDREMQFAADQLLAHIDLFDYCDDDDAPQELLGWVKNKVNLANKTGQGSMVVFCDGVESEQIQICDITFDLSAGGKIDLKSIDVENCDI